MDEIANCPACQRPPQQSMIGAGNGHDRDESETYTLRCDGFDHSIVVETGSKEETIRVWNLIARR